MNKKTLSITNRKKGQTLLKIRNLFAYGKQFCEIPTPFFAEKRLFSQTGGKNFPSR